MFKTILNFFRKPAPIISRDQTHIFVDGDQIGKSDHARLYRKTENVKWFWVSGTPTPKFLDPEVNYFKSKSIAKESVDCLIAMMAIKECIENQRLKKLVIVSGDGDFIEILLTMSDMYPHINFVWLRPSKANTKTSIKALDALKNLPKNVQHFRLK
jgi:hypothetical protein